MSPTTDPPGSTYMMPRMSLQPQRCAGSNVADRTSGPMASLKVAAARAAPRRMDSAAMVGFASVPAPMKSASPRSILRVAFASICNPYPGTMRAENAISPSPRSKLPAESAR